MCQFFGSGLKAAMLQEQAMFTGVVGIVSAAVSWVLQNWLCSVRSDRRKLQSTERKAMKTNTEKHQGTQESSVMIATASVVASVLTNICASCLLP
jgi:hypothetical protein